MDEAPHPTGVVEPRDKAALEVERIRQDFPMLHRRMNGLPLVYLDNAATSQKPQAMIERLRSLYAEEYAKVEEGHSLSQHATKVFEEVRAKVARLIHAAEPREIIFTRGCTEALNLISRAFERSRLGPGDEVLITLAEHASNFIPWQMACEDSGATLKAVPVTPSGELDLERFEQLLGPRTRIVAVSHVSNVTGTIYPVKRITEMAHARGIPVLVDGAQAVPHLPVDVRDIGCDFYAGSGHKMGGPSSVGFLYGIASKLEELPVADGGSTMAETVSLEKIQPKPLPHKYEAGEPCFGEAVAWGPAIDYWMDLGMERIAAYEKELTAYATGKLLAIPGVRVLGAETERISVLSFTVQGVPPKELEKELDRRGIAVRAGELDAEPLLKALGTDMAVRASFLFYNTREEADALAEAVAELARLH
ncbi:cysteine desulfurase/selenocysteine lyase [Archangium gephyra]|uniref:Probable cysteine desulfurase n=1 Tax=Archangium gephyra TaxID=48 RepID=A0AAC8THQ0_9BACT|nr:aminotransferase class V-fold PLP-dependent enzyme [Archangium gephyra]AKJ04786.1 Cysteine desulfurase [Archangium gephyra]REG37163.1 cysteine desulfurase/selenocysteine lyase [Archangium gephyra]